MKQHTIDTTRVSRSEREQELLQKGKVLWMTGLSGSGKTTNALLLERKLFSAGFLCKVIDGDDVRSGLNKDLGFSIEDREENIRRVAELSKLLVNSGLIVICCFISPTNHIRNIARTIIGEADFVEIFVDSPVEICENRDVKGLYKMARSGSLTDFTGISSPFESPQSPSLILPTATLTPLETCQLLYDHVLGLVRIAT